MPNRIRNCRFRITAPLYIWFAFALVCLPVKWVLAWCLAILVHEFCHYLAIKLCKEDVFSVTFGLKGAIMQTTSISNAKQIVCALSCPLDAPHGSLCIRSKHIQSYANLSI